MSYAVHKEIDRQTNGGQNITPPTCDAGKNLQKYARMRSSSKLFNYLYVCLSQLSFLLSFGFLEEVCLFCHPTDSVKALKEQQQLLLRRETRLCAFPFTNKSAESLLVYLFIYLFIYLVSYLLTDDVVVCWLPQLDAHVGQVINSLIQVGIVILSVIIAQQSMDTPHTSSDTRIVFSTPTSDRFVRLFIAPLKQFIRRRGRRRSLRAAAILHRDQSSSSSSSSRSTSSTSRGRGDVKPAATTARRRSDTARARV